MIKSEETRVDRAIRWLKNNRILAGLVIFGLVIIAIASFTDAASKIAATAEKLFQPDPLRGIPSSVDFAEWAIEFGRAKHHTSDIKDVPKAHSPKFTAANNVANASYKVAVNALRTGCLSYREHGFPNIYLDLPSFPDDIFGYKISNYIGTVKFSRYCSWFISVEPPTEAENPSGPVLKVEFMDGDGTVKGAAGVGSMELWYNFASKSIRIKSTGIVIPIIHDIPKSILAHDFPKVVAYIVKLMVEQQLSNCQTTKDGAS